MGEHHLALPGQPLETPAALDDHHAELLFELDDRGRKRRLRDVAGFGRLAEMLLAGERVEIDELADDHGRMAFPSTGAGPGPTSSSRSSPPPVFPDSAAAR